MIRRVLHVSQPSTAGVPQVLLDDVRALVSSDVAVAVAAPAALAARVREAGATFFEWEATRSPNQRTLAESCRLSRVIERWRPEVVHLHSAKAGLAGRLALRGGLPTVFQPHAWSFSAVTGPMATSALLWERFAARWAHAIVCCSQAEQQEGVDQGIAGRWRVLPNRVDLTRWQPDDRRAARLRLGLPVDAPVAVCVGRLCRQKGQDCLVRIWPQVRAVLPRAVLVLVGDGPDEAELRAQAGEGIHFAGSVTDAGPWYAAADVVVAPSRWEGMALVPLEAQACGRPVIASDVTGMRESIADASDLFAADACRALRDLVLRVLTDLPATHAAGDRARADLMARGSFEGLAEDVLGIYNQVARPGGRLRSAAA